MLRADGTIVVPSNELQIIVEETSRLLSLVINDWEAEMTSSLCVISTLSLLMGEEKKNSAQ